MTANRSLYQKIFARNGGVFTKQQLLSIKTLRVGVVGVGALGGAVAVMLARLGISYIKMIDPDRFEYNNINRQFGAYVDTVGIPKVQAVASELRRINPQIEVDKWIGKLTARNASRFLSGIDVVVDAIDFFDLVNQEVLYNYSFENNLWIHTAQAAGSLFTVFNFNPNGPSYRELLKEINIENAIKFFFPVLPKEATPEIINEIIEKRKVHVASYSVPAPIGASLVVNELIKKHIERQNIVESPNLTLVDLGRMKIEILNRKV